MVPVCTKNVTLVQAPMTAVLSLSQNGETMAIEVKIYRSVLATPRRLSVRKQKSNLRLALLAIVIGCENFMGHNQ